MLNFFITPFVKGKKYSLELEEFEPKGGYELFLRNVCPHLGARFCYWHQGFEIGVGKIIYNNYQIEVYWSDFPFALSFDCENEAMAQELQEKLKQYFETHKN